MLCSLDEDTGDIDELEEPMPYGESFRVSRLQLRLSLLLDFSRLVLGGDAFFSVSLVAVLKWSLFENDELEWDGDFSACELSEESLFLGDIGESVSCLVLFGDSDL